MIELSALPDGHVFWSRETGEVTLAELRGEPVRYITTEDAARIFSYRPETWARWAPSIPGAFKDRLWRLPLAACEAHIARLRDPKRRRRVPWKARKATFAPPARARASHMEAR